MVVVAFIQLILKKRIVSDGISFFPLGTIFHSPLGLARYGRSGFRELILIPTHGVEREREKLKELMDLLHEV